MRSDWRGEARKTSAPKRAMSNRDAEAAIISIAQHARPKPIGQIDDSRAQLRIAIDARRDEIVFEPMVNEAHSTPRFSE